MVRAARSIIKIRLFVTATRLGKFRAAFVCTSGEPTYQEHKERGQPLPSDQ